MPVSAINYIKEIVRQKKTDDSAFLERMLYYFELRIPAAAQLPGTGANFFFPLILPPKSYTLEEPFAVQVTPTHGAGLYAEENGIIQRMIRIRGNTGFRPRPLKFFGGYGKSPIPQTTAEKSYTRKLKTVLLDAISGQKHFQYLQDAVFRTYGDLKRNPATSEGTFLIFHNPKDSEHWIVLPQKFTLERDSSNPVIYNYSIDLLAVGKAEDAKKDFSEDKNILDYMKDGLNMVKLGLDLTAGALNDLTALQAQLAGQIRNVAVILDSVSNILVSAQAFVDGTTDLIQTPYAALESINNMIDQAIGLVIAGRELQEEAEAIPDKTIQKFREIQEGLELMGTNPANWETPTDTSMKQIREAQEFGKTITQFRRQTAMQAEAFTTLAQVRNSGTSLTAGDIQSMNGQVSPATPITNYTSFKQVRINYGDTLASLAAKYLGDARLWQYLALINGLNPPFIDAQATTPFTKRYGIDETPFGRVLGVGSWISVPSNLPATINLPLLPVLGVKLEEPVENQLLGTDFMLEAVYGLAGSSRAFYDIPVDTAGGSIDAKLVSGIANLKQGLVSRLSTEKGTCILYKSVGVDRIIALNFDLADIENAKYRIQEAIEADSRIAEIQSVEFEQDLDALVTTIKAVPRGFTEAKTLQIAI